MMQLVCENAEIIISVIIILGLIYWLLKGDNPYEKWNKNK